MEDLKIVSSAAKDFEIEIFFGKDVDSFVTRTTICRNHEAGTQ
jgi:hypothetical protein